MENGKEKLGCRNPAYLIPNTPVLQYSNSAILQCSVTPNELFVTTGVTK
jgi:hypothetical protein